MPSHPGAVEEIRAAFRSGDFSRAEAARLLRAEGITNEAAINAMLDVSASAGEGNILPGPGQAPLGSPFQRGLTATANFAFPIPPSTAPGEPPPGTEPPPTKIIDPTGGPGGGPIFVDPDPAPTPAPPPVVPPPVVFPPVGDPAGEGNILPGPGEDPTNRPLTLLELQQQESRTRGGRGRLFDQFLGQQGNISNLALQTLRQKFDPFSAAFVLKNVLNPGAPEGDQQAGQLSGISNFAGFLGGNGSVLGGQGFLQALSQLSGIFGTGATNTQQTQATALTDDRVAQNIIASGFASQFNPFLRDAARQVSGRNVAQFQGGNVDLLPLFQAFLQGQLGGGQGQFFGGF